MTFTARELQLLVEQVFIGNWVSLSAETETEKEITELYQKLLRTARDSGILGGIQNDHFTNEFFLPMEREDELIGQIDEFTDDAFWDTLTMIFAERDIKKKFNPRMIANMTEEKYAEIFAKEEEKYLDEIEKHGTDRLRFDIGDENAADK
jgi:hypothetical protein